MVSLATLPRGGRRTGFKPRTDSSNNTHGGFGEPVRTTDLRHLAPPRHRVNLAGSYRS